MAFNQVIGIGGTGARCIESLVHLCAAGLGPEQLHIMFVDPDKSNGNLSWTRQLIQNYISCREIRNGKNFDGDLFKTEIIVDEVDTWTIFEDANSKLWNHINLNGLLPNERAFAELLFTKEELETDLSEGFRGHPAIGSVVMANYRNVGPWINFWEKVNEFTSAYEGNVFIFGSVFGGTGAAGFPTLARLIKNNESCRIINEGVELSKIKLGGVLLLPYFSFDSPEDEFNQMHVQSGDFPLSTKAALNYYYEKDIDFDTIYLLGENFTRKLGSFSVGASNQKNESHYIELIAAYSFFDFITSEPIIDKKYLISGRQEAEKNNIIWDNLPYTERLNIKDELSSKTREKIACLTTFSHSFINYLEPRSEEQLEFDNWYNTQFKGKGEQISLFDTKVRDRFSEIKKYTSKFLLWAHEITTSPESASVNLFNKDSLKSNWAMDPFSIFKLLKVKEDYQGKKDEVYFRRIMDSYPSYSPQYMDATDRAVKLLYDSSKKFSQEIYFGGSNA